MNLDIFRHSDYFMAIMVIKHKLNCRISFVTLIINNNVIEINVVNGRLENVILCKLTFVSI